MRRRGFDGVATGPVLDDYPGLPAYMAEVVDEIRGQVSRGHQSRYGRPISEEAFRSGLAADESAQRMLTGIMGDYLSMLNFEKAGRKVFQISSALVDRLAATAMDAPSEYLRLPFPSCLFVIRAPTAIDDLYKIGGGQPCYDAPLSIFLSEFESRGMRKIMIQVFHSNDVVFHSFVKRELLIHPEWTIERSLCTDWTTLFEQNPDWGAADPAAKCEDESVFYDDGLQFFRIVVNTILYLASSDPDISLRASPVEALSVRAAATLNRYKKHELLEEASRYSALDGAIAGANVAPIIVAPRCAVVSAKHGAAQTRPNKRIIVRGHWRNQAYGEGMADRKLIWIQPYWKGPEMAELVGRPYVVR